MQIVGSSVAQLYKHMCTVGRDIVTNTCCTLTSSETLRKTDQDYTTFLWILWSPEKVSNNGAGWFCMIEM